MNRQNTTTAISMRDPLPIMHRPFIACASSVGSEPTARADVYVVGRGPDARVTFYLEAYRGKVWITLVDCLFTCVTILDPTQVDNLVELINQTSKEAREYRP